MKGITAVLASSIGFAIVAVTIRAIGGGVPALTLSFLRVLISTVLIAAVLVPRDRGIFRQKRSDLSSQ